MKSTLSRKTLLIVFDVIILLLCIAGIEQSRQKAWLRASVEPDSSAVARVSAVSPGEDVLRAGDALISIAGYRVRQVLDVEHVLNRYRAGSETTITFRRDGRLLTRSYRLTTFYSTSYLLIQTAGVLIFFSLAFFVISRKPRERDALLFHQLAITVAAIIAFTHGNYMMEPVGVGHVLRALFPSVNVFIGVLVLHFSFVFPRPKPVPLSLLIAIYAIGTVIAVAGGYASVRSVMPMDLSWAATYYSLLRLAKLGMIVGAMAGIAVLILRFVRLRDSIARRQIAWVVIGVGFSIMIYAVLYLPTTSSYFRSLLPAESNRLLDAIRIDESMLIFSLVLTGSFMSFALIRYRFFDIEYFFRRGTIYGLVFLVLILIYSGIIWGITRITGQTPNTLFYAGSILALLIDLLLFLPLRNLAQRTVDRYFFRIEYDFRAGLKSLTTEISDTVDAEQMARTVVDGIDNLMHLYGIMVMTVHGKRELRVLARSGFPRWRYPSITVHERRLQALPRRPLLLTDVVEAGADVREIAMPFARRYGVSLIYTLRAEDGTVLGLLVLGAKRSGTAFTLEDLDLLHSVSVQAGLHLERINLQERLLIEKKEAEKLRELSQMKSYFVSGVSHDLKTPLTSIKLFAELLEQQIAQDDEAGRKYVGIIQGECDRLGRMINNILDFTKIERGMMQYTFTPTDVNAVVQRAYDVMQYQFVLGGFSCELSLAENGRTVNADADALLEALTNILANAMKYSGGARDIHLRTTCDNAEFSIEVEDHGLGIDTSDIPHLFEPFYRSHSGDVQKHGGIGLGLALVKHIVDAHRGRVHVHSAPGKGSTFTISLKTQEGT